MSKTLEQTIHEAALPSPAPGGEDFNSYVSRVAHAAAFIGAAWAISNGPQVQAPPPGEIGEPHVHEPEGDWMARPEGEVTDGPLDQDSPRHIVTEHE
jgi:hypothetical protein